MADWAKNKPSGVSGQRRNWDKDNRASLNNLKQHIAKEGCPETQYNLGRQLLEDAIQRNELTTTNEAIDWLILASEQDHDAAIELLRDCYANGTGITPDNATKVRACVTMTPAERSARKAAREIFACLSKGGEHITPKQLERKMREIYKMQRRRRRGSASTSEDEDPKPLEGSGGDNVAGKANARRRNAAHLDGHEVITEANLVAAAENYTAGRMPDVSDDLTLSAPDQESLDHLPCFLRLFFHPLQFFLLLYHRLINFVSALPALVPLHLRLAILLLCYWMGCRENMNTYVPVGFYYGCLAVMIWSTCKMLKTKQDFIDFRIWSGLFLSYGENVQANSSENLFLKNNMRPYLYFFVAFVGNLMVYPFIANAWLPHSELTIISGIFVFTSLVAFMYSSARGFPDWLILVSFGVNVLAKYPYEMDDVVTTGWRFLDLKVPTFSTFVIGNGIEFCLNCRAALYLLIPGFLYHLAKRASWHGTYSYLLPHCVTLSWLQLCITISQRATMFGMVRAALVVAGSLLYLPLFGIVSLLIPVFVAIEWMGFTEPSIRWGSTFAATLLVLLGTIYLAVKRNAQRYITALQIIVLVIAACVLTFPYMTSNFKDSRFNDLLGQEDKLSIPAVEPLPHSSEQLLSWQRFYVLCGHPAWSNNNRIKAQMRCSHLDGMTVRWEGTVSHVQIAHVSNTAVEFMVNYLPRWLTNLLHCLLGESTGEKLKCNTKSDFFCEDLKDLVENTQLQGKCTLQKWNAYEYEVRINMPGGLLSKGPNVVLQAEHIFGNFTSKIQSGDRIRFTGTLTNNHRLIDGSRQIYVLGSSLAHVRLTAVECVECLKPEIPSIITQRVPKSPVNARMRDLRRGFQYLLNVLFNPLIKINVEI